MLLALAAYVGGVLTIVSPCILPVLPFVFARAGQPFLRSGLPMLLGMAITFAGVATLAAVAGGWAVAANEYGRLVAAVVLAGFGVTLLFPAIAERAARPLVALGGRLSSSAEGGGGVGMSLLLGVATGLLWAPCAGPVLGLILTGAALQGANLATSLLLLAYAAGAATSLALALLAGGRLHAAMKRSLGVSNVLRRVAGWAVLAAVLAIALGLDTGLLTRLSVAGTGALEQRVLDRLNPPGAQPAPAPVAMTGPAMTGPAMMSANPAMAGGQAMMMMAPHGQASTEPLAIEGQMPPLAGAVERLNSPPLTTEGLRGKVVLIDFWTYSCINCVRAIPYVRAWADKYKDQGLVVIGVHTPEFAFEKTIGNVRKAAVDQQVTYPVAIDNNYAIWRAFKNRYWPAHYFVDAEGRVRHHHFGEGGCDRSERVIQQLLAEAGKKSVASGLVAVRASGAEMASDMKQVGSPETYAGYEQMENFISPGGAAEDKPRDYTVADPRLNE